MLLARRARRNDGSVSTNRASSTPAQISDSACACAAAGVWNACASDGIAIVAAASTVSVETIRARSESNCCTPFFRPADDERDPEHEHAVREDRADERGLDDVDEPLVEREQGDEELGQVAERRLDDARAAGAEPGAELLGRGADEPGEAGERHRGDDERQDVAEPAKWQTAATATRAATDRQLDALPAVHGREPNRAYSFEGSDRGATAPKPELARSVSD